MADTAPVHGTQEPGSAAATRDVVAEARDISLRIGANTILEHVDLVAHRGEIVTVIGPNGSGKSTLLKVLLGLIEPDSGHSRLAPGIRIGYMPQRLAIDPTLPLTVSRFLGLGGGDSKKHRAVLAEVGAERIIDSPVQDISGGELQRVLLARALLREPDLLVLDEPVQSVDVTGQTEIHNLITRIRDRRGCTVIMVSHDLHLVMSSTNTVLCLNHHVCCTGHPEVVSRDPAYLALFGPEIAAGLAAYSHHHDHHHGPSGEVVPEAGEGPGDG